MITSQILCDSVNPVGIRLATFLLTYPLFIHAELMTHRAFSRNAGSSRAIPLATMLANVDLDPAIPTRWPAEQKGMQGGESLGKFDGDTCHNEWLNARDECMGSAERMAGSGLHKSIANRIIAPWAHITVIVTATHAGLQNFFELRAHKDADDNFQVLAFRMLRDYMESRPRELFWGHWHIPYAPDPKAIYTGTAEDNRVIIRPAVGRIARVSFNRHDSEDVEANGRIYERMMENGHWSPFEHVAQAWGTHKRSNFDSGYDNLCGWRQYRKEFLNECRSSKSLPELMDAKPDWITL